MINTIEKNNKSPSVAARSSTTKYGEVLAAMPGE
jgi:hypothetical protein